VGYDKLTRKIVYISGTRADYGLMQAVLKKINNHQAFDLEIIITGMHLMKEFGNTYKEIIKDGFTTHKINSIYKKDDKESMAIFIADFIKKLTKKLKRIKPDFILLLGDRGEMLGGAIVGSYLSIPNVHLHGGEVTSTVDEIARHAITKLSHVHLVSNKRSAKRIKEMGENPEYIHVVGAPGLDAILGEALPSKDFLVKKYNIDNSKPLVMVLQHPVTLEVDKAKEQIRKTLDVLNELKYQTILIYPNADAGGRKMIEEIKKYEKKDFLQTYKNIPRKEYLGLLKICDVLVGNSSSGIIEAASFNLPVVNIGSRQYGRERAENVIDVAYNKKEIKRAIDKSISNKKFKEKIKNIKNPYGDGKTGERVVDILENIKINKKLLQKTY
jgi:GDP/UDP-N,N'-diacetylbacillosamine 2-epimerase (hydrolysing)